MAGRVITLGTGLVGSGTEYSDFATALAAVPAGGTLRVFPGTYTFTQVSSAVTNVTVEGVGDPTTVILQTTTTTDGVAIIDINHAGWAFRNVTIQGASAVGDDCWLIDSSTTPNQVRLQNVRIDYQGTHQAGLTGLFLCDENCVFNLYSGAGANASILLASAGENYFAGKIIENSATPTTFYVNNAAAYLFLGSCRFYDNSGGTPVWVDVNSGYVKAVQVATLDFPVTNMGGATLYIDWEPEETVLVVGFTLYARATTPTTAGTYTAALTGDADSGANNLLNAATIDLDTAAGAGGTSWNVAPAPFNITGTLTATHANRQILAGQHVRLTIASNNADLAGGGDGIQARILYVTLPQW